MGIWTKEYQERLDSLLTFERGKLLVRPFRVPAKRPTRPYRYNPDTQGVAIDEPSRMDMIRMNNADWEARR